MDNLCGPQNDYFPPRLRKSIYKVPVLSLHWDSRAREKHWNQKEWPIRETLQAGMPNIVNDPTVMRENIIFIPLHIKLGLMKQFVKALNTNGECF